MGTCRTLSVTTTSTIAILTASALPHAARGGSAEAMVSGAATLAVLVGVILSLASLSGWGGCQSHIGTSPGRVQSGRRIDHCGGSGSQAARSAFHQGPFLSQPGLRRGSPPAGVRADDFARASDARPAARPAAIPSPRARVARDRSRWHRALGARRARSLGVELVGEVKGGLPSFALPDMSLFEPLWPAAIGIALMSFVETIAAGQAFRGPDEPRPGPNKELLAIGLTNLVGGLFHNLPSGGGTSQTAVNQRAGARSQLAGLVTAAVVVAVLYFLAPLVHLMPQATLAVVVIVPCAGMIKLPEFRAIWQTRLMEFSWAIASVAGVLLLGTLRGILVAVVLSLLALSVHGSRRPVFVLGRKPGTDVSRPRSKEHPEDESFPGLLLLKTEGMIHFANVQRIGDLMWPLISKHKPRVVVPGLQRDTGPRIHALKMLTEMEKRLQAGRDQPMVGRIESGTAGIGAEVGPGDEARPPADAFQPRAGSRELPEATWRSPTPDGPHERPTAVPALRSAFWAETAAGPAVTIADFLGLQPPVRSRNHVSNHFHGLAGVAGRSQIVDSEPKE